MTRDLTSDSTDFDRYFDQYRSSQSRDWWDDDPILQCLIARGASDSAASVTENLAQLSPEISTDFRHLADEGARVENLPQVRHFNAYRERIDEVILPTVTRELMSRIYMARPFHKDLNPWELYGRLYLLSQLGEAGVMCSLACTDGMVQLLRRFADTPPLKTILSKLENGDEGRFYHAAQFVTEIQGGSDAATNVLSAQPETGGYRLYGNKWFCSNITADYFVVTARPQGAPAGASGVALFAVPAYDEKTGARNGYRIDRIKNKLGTQSLPTVELTFDGAVAYPIGPLHKGLSNVVSIVLTTSRLHCALTNAAFLRQAYRQARHYANFRQAFGQPIAEFPLIKQGLRDLEDASTRLVTGTFDILSRQLALAAASRGDAASSPEHARKLYVLRILIMLNKVHVSREASERIHQAISIFGGNGIEEEWSSVPRLLRDAIINEVWEGPHSLLITRSLLDLENGPLTPAQFVDDALVSAPQEVKAAITDELDAVLHIPQTEEKTIAFAEWAARFSTHFQRSAMRRLAR